MDDHSIKLILPYRRQHFIPIRLKTRLETTTMGPIFVLSEMLPGIALPSKGIETREGVDDSRGSRDRSHGSLRVHIGFLL